jgi:aryl-alcohol dehydrogenase-like predicted oxidoreductase
MAPSLAFLFKENTMDYRGLGSTGMQVSNLCLGAMMFGAWGEPDHQECVRIIHRALDAGINFIDTADVYSRGESEEIVGKALAGGRRENVILATKFHGPMDVGMGEPGGDPNQRGNSRRWIVKEVEASLQRLQTDWIDLYQVHRPEAGTDIEETLSALTDLRAQGKIRAFGCSTFPAHELVEAHWTAERRALGRFATEQPPYSLVVRGIEADVLPVAQRYGMGVIPWSPLAGGWLTGAWRKGREAPQSRRAQRLPARFDLSLPGNQRKLEAADRLAQLAEQSGMSLIHMALAFTLAHPAVTAPIIGPRTMEQLESQLGAADLTLSKDVLDRIDEIVPPGTTFADGDRGYVPPTLSRPELRRLPSGLA